MQVIKYPKTYHLSFSEGINSDDKILKTEDETKLLSSEVVVTIKMDGGNVGFDTDVFHARSTKPAKDDRFSYIKNTIYYPTRHLLNPNYKYFGENMYATHSIKYTELTSYFYLFNILDKTTNQWLSWENIKEEANRLSLELVTTILKGKTDVNTIKQIFASSQTKTLFGGDIEGLVIRSSDVFSHDDWYSKIGKLVRKNHIQTTTDWNGEETNLLKTKE